MEAKRPGWLFKTTLYKSIVHEVNNEDKNNRPILNEIINFYTTLRPLFVHDVMVEFEYSYTTQNFSEIECRENINVIENYLKDNNIFFLRYDSSESSMETIKYVYSFLNESDALAFKLKFVD